MADISTFWNSKDQLSSALRALTFISVSVTAALGFALYRLNDRIGELQQQTIDEQGHQLGQQREMLERQNGLLEEQSNRLSTANKGLSEAVQRSQTLLQQNAELQASVAKAASKHAALQRKANDQTTKPAAADHGVEDTYDFKGGHRVRAGGRTTLISGEEPQVFQRLLQMQAAGQWAELLLTSEAQIKKTPTWLTPYLCAGIAEAILGNFGAARTRLQYVVTHAGGDPNYAEAQRILAQLPK